MESSTVNDNTLKYSHNCIFIFAGLAMYSDSSSTTESSENSETFPGFQQIPLAHFGSQQNIWAGETDRLKARQTYKGRAPFLYEALYFACYNN